MHLHFALAQFVQACPYGAAVAVRGADRPVDTLARLIGCMINEDPLGLACHACENLSLTRVSSIILHLPILSLGAQFCEKAEGVVEVYDMGKGRRERVQVRYLQWDVESTFQTAFKILSTAFLDSLRQACDRYGGNPLLFGMKSGGRTANVVENERLTGRGKSTKPVIRRLVSRRISGLMHFPEMPTAFVSPEELTILLLFCRHSIGAINRTLC